MSQSKRHRFRASVSVRVPRTGDGTLVSEAVRRLETEAVESVTVTEFCGLEPGLSATVVQLDVEVELVPSEPKTVTDALERAPGVQRIESVTAQKTRGY